MSQSVDGKHGSKTIDITRHLDENDARPLLADVGRLTIAYCVWKILLIAAVLASPGSGYDTSTQLLFEQNGEASERGIARVLYNLSLRLTRWDGIYFTALSHNGHVHEQQWAFSWLLTRFTSRLTDGVSDASEGMPKLSLSVLLLPQSLPSIVQHALTGSIVSLISHLGAVIVLYLLIDTILPSKAARRRQIALTTAYLHIISPAGVFLIAPSAEAPFAFVNLAASLSYAYAILARTKNETTSETAWMLVSASLFGLACTLRGNGILNGVIFAWNALKPTFDILFGARNLLNFRRLSTAGLAGVIVAVGFALPQYVAFQQYCNDELQRPWCTRVPPSIYSWVQDHYWNVGLFKYWTFGNAPLFVLAAPVIFLLLNTGYAAVHHTRSLLIAINGEERPPTMKSTAYQAQRLAFEHVLERLAVPQIVLAIMALTSFHVQIINRISSAYPVWYLVIAIALHDRSPRLECGHSRSEHYYPFRLLRGRLLQVIVQGFVVYAVLQAGLYSAFLPPA